MTIMACPALYHMWSLTYLSLKSFKELSKWLNYSIGITFDELIIYKFFGYDCCRVTSSGVTIAQEHRSAQQVIRIFLLSVIALCSFGNLVTAIMDNSIPKEVVEVSIFECRNPGRSPESLQKIALVKKISRFE